MTQITAHVHGFSTQTRIESGTPFALFLYGAQDVDNFYPVRIRFDTDKISILKEENVSWSELTGTYVKLRSQAGHLVRARSRVVHRRRSSVDALR